MSLKRLKGKRGLGQNLSGEGMKLEIAEHSNGNKPSPCEQAD